MAAAAAVSIMMLLCGCSRDTIKYQIAESIGTLGMYENGEPVETPRMKEEREQREALEAQEAAFQEELDAAGTLAASYRYKEAIEYLQKVEENEVTRDRLEETISQRAPSVSSRDIREYERIRSEFSSYKDEGRLRPIGFC